MMKGNSQFSTVKSQLPKGWEIKKLGEVCENLDRQRIPIEKNKRVAGVVPYYGASGIVDYVEGYLFDEELLCVSEDGANLLARTYPIAFSIQGKTWVNNHAHVLRFANKSTQNFVKLYINFIKIDKYVSGMAQPKLNQKKLNSILIPLPPLAEQQRIVAKLDALFAKIQALETKTKQNLENAKELFKSYLQGVFENKGDDWEEKKLGDIGILTSSKRIYKKEYTEKGVPFYRSKEIKELGNNRDISIELYISKERYLEIKSKFGVPQKGDILLTAVGTIGEMYVVKDNEEFYFKDGNIMWLKDFTTLNTYYLKYALTSFVDILKSMARGAAYSALTIEKLREYSIPLPPLSEQQRIVEKLDSLSAETKKLEQIYQQKLVLLAELKESLLDKAFKGEL